MLTENKIRVLFPRGKTTDVCCISEAVCCPGGSGIKNLPASAGEAGSIPGSGIYAGRGKWQATPVFLPGKCHGQRKLEVYSPPGHRKVRHDLVTKQQ